MSKSDGTIVFSTEMDNKELAKQVEEAKKEVKDIESQIDKLNKERSSAVKAQAKAQEKLTKAQEEYNAALEKSIEAGEKAQAARAALQAAEEKRKQLISDISTSRDAKEKTRLSEELNSQMDAISQARAEWETAEAAAASYDGAVANAAQKVDAATANLRSADGAVAGIDASLSSASATLGEAEAKAGGLENQFKKAEDGSKKLPKPIDKASAAVNKLGKRIARVAASALVFSTLYKAFGALKERLSDAVEQSEEASKAMAQLSGAAKAAAQPLIDILVPALTALAQVLTRAIVLTGSLFGKDFIKDASDAAQALDKVKKAKQSLAGFDEITTVGGNENDQAGTSYEFEDVLTGETSESVKRLTKIVASAALAVGALLCFSGVAIGLGLSLMVAGAAALVAEMKEDWNSTNNKVSSAISGVLTVVMAALFVIGAILIFSGAAIPLGIGMMVAGAAIAAAVVNWDSIAEALQGPIGAVTAIVSAALLALGVILLFSGAGIPLGLGLILVGAAGLATVVALNWNTIVESIESVVSKILEWIKTYGLLVLGVLLCLSGAGIPFGLAIIINWAKQNEGKVDLADKILGIVRSVWSSIKNFWNSNIAPVFTAKWWKNLAVKCGNGLKAGFANAVNGVISVFEKMINWVVGGLNKISFDVPDWVPGIGGKKFGFNIDPVSLDRVEVPALAKGAVLPANQPFLAMVGDQKHGTNVEAPLTVIQDAVALVMEDITNGMMAGFEALLEENQRLRAVVEGIDIGDSTIGQAANRYNQRMAIIRG